MKINIDFTVYKKMTYYIKHTEGEISGLAKVERDKEDKNIFNITDIVLLEQTCTGATTNLDSNAIGKFYDELMKNKQDTGAWKCWWHSHADMSTFWSTTDSNTIESLDPETEIDNYIISIVSNKKEEVLARIDCFNPIRATVDELEVEIPYIDNELEEACRLEVEEKVKKNSIVTTYPSYQNYGNYSNYDNYDSYYYNQGNRTLSIEEQIVKKSKEDKRLERLFNKSNVYDPMEISGKKNPPDKFICSTGVYIMGKDMLYHKKLRNITKQEAKRIDIAVDKELGKRDKGKKINKNEIIIPNEEYDFMKKLEQKGGFFV